SLLLGPIAAIWGFLFIFAAAPPIDRFLIEIAMIGVPFILLLVMFAKQGQVFLVYFKAMKKYLQDTKRAVDTGQGDVDITTYINLLFIILRPESGTTEDKPQEAILEIDR
ncbi:unnamed protein product, partial [marine sediment metagenome]